MNPIQPRIIELIEYEDKSFRRHEIPDSIGENIYDKYKSKIDIEFPSYKTRNHWKIKPKGWVGYIPVTPEFGLRINPKVPIKNLMGMLEYTYHLKSFQFLEGLIDCESIEEFYNYLAEILAQKIIEQFCKGLYRAYLPKTEQVAYIRGRVDVRKAIQKPWDVKLKCHYEEYTADIAENKILAWTLYIIGRSGLCTERVSSTVRKAYHSLQGLVKLQFCSAEDCIGRQYNRLNENYRILHNICRFFLENSSPTHQRGKHTFFPFIVNMAHLYETFVAEWLKVNLPPNLILKSQERLNIGETLYFQTDLVIYDALTLKPRYILDTKYKTPVSPSSQDVAQVVTYAVSKICPEVILVYPNSLTHPLNQLIGNIRVRSLTFSLDNNLDYTGQIFLQNLLFNS